MRLADALAVRMRLSFVAARAQLGAGPMSTPDQPSGPHEVSVCDVRLPDHIRPALRMRMFYPATLSEGGTRARWFPPSPKFPDITVTGLLRYARVPAVGLLSIPLSFTLPKIEIPAYESTPLKPRRDRYPVLLFSHGLAGFLGTYSNFCLDRASHGYVVLAPEHSDGSGIYAHIGVERRLMQFVSYDPDVHGRPEEAYRRKQLETRVADLDATMQALRETCDGDSRVEMVPLRRGTEAPNLCGKVDLNDISVAGHSFGSATMVLYSTRCGKDRPDGWITPRSAVLLDGWYHILREQLDSLRFDGTEVLFVDMGASSLRSSVEARRAWAYLREEGTARKDVIVVKDGVHQDSSDVTLRTPQWMLRLGGQAAPEVHPVELLKAQNLATYHFLQGAEAWARFRERVRSGEVRQLRLGQLTTGMGPDEPLDSIASPLVRRENLSGTFDPQADSPP